MKKDNESPYRYYRVVSVKKIDRWFFDRYDHRRTHAKIYETVIRPKFGMCENTFLDYRHEPDELLELFPQSASVEFSLWLPTVQTKYMVPAEANRFSLMLWDSIDKAFRCIRRREPGCWAKTFSAPVSISNCSCTPGQGVTSAAKRPR